jgi:hypothetical protein
MSTTWHVRCSCLDEDGKPLTIRETCLSCAESTAESHRAQGHSVTIQAPIDRWERISALKERRGW